MPENDRQEQHDASKDDFARRILAASAIVSLFVGGFLWIGFAPSTLLLIFASIWFGCVLHHAAMTLASWSGFSEYWTRIIVVFVILALITGFFILLGVQIGQRIGELAQNLQQAASNLLQTIEHQFPELAHFVETTSLQQALRIALQGASGSTLAAWLVSPLGLLFNMIIVFFTGVYFAASPKRYRDGLVALLPKNKQPRLRDLCDEIGYALWRWTLARGASMVIVGVSSGIGLALLGIPMAGTLGALTGIIVFIPNLGPLLSVLPPMLLAFSQGPWYVFYVALLYGGIQLVESYLLTPIIHEHEDNLPAALVIICQLVFGFLFGLLGVVFAMPITLAGKIAVERLYLGREE